MSILDKSLFYEQLKPFKNRHLPIFFFLDFGDKSQYTLVFDWTSTKPNGAFNPIMYAQLYDNRLSGSTKYIVPDLVWDCKKEGTTTDYKLYKFLSKWITRSITAKEEN